MLSKASAIGSNLANKSSADLFRATLVTPNTNLIRYQCSRPDENDRDIRRPVVQAMHPKLLRAFICSFDCDNPLQFKLAVHRKPMSAFVGSA